MTEIHVIDDESDAEEQLVIRKRKAQTEEKVGWTDESDGAPMKPKRRKAKRKSKRPTKLSDAGDIDGDPDLDGVPDYLQERRRAFDAYRKLHHQAALMLPPDYSGICFDESARLGELLERPQFSGIKPSRPYRDLELPQSAGLIPASIAQYLRDYQLAGVRFLHRKFVYQEGGILGDDMGLGKTVQVVAFLTAAYGKTGDERDAKRMREVRLCCGRWYPRVLIICPGSLIMNWKSELARWGWWHVDVFHGPNKDDVLGTARSGLLEIMITTYDTYKNNRSAINMVEWDAVIADECHRLKDRYSDTTKALNEVNTLCRIGLTGTAIQNRYDELWTLLDWTNPGHFGTQAEWAQAITRPLTVGQSHEATFAQLSLARQTAQKLVHNLLPRYFVRRMKSLIADQLPKKTDRVVFCPLTDLQRTAYENFLSSPDLEVLRTISDPCPHGGRKGFCCQTELPSGGSWQRIVFPSIMVLQKLANHLTLLAPSATDQPPKQEAELKTLRACLPDRWRTLYEERDRIGSLVNPEFCGKWKVLKRLLKFWHGNGDKVLVFSHSVRLLRILQHLFINTSYSVSYLDGSLSYEHRQEVVDTFNSDATQFVFLISTKAGGVGLNITAANKVVIMDPHWNPSYDLQAQDRAYRIGQTRDVDVFRLISLGTVEEIVYARQIYKQQQANIGYTASSERRYFRGVQEDMDRKGEIFGLSNIFTYHADASLLRDIVNQTNVAEAKAGVNLADVDMQKAAEEDDLDAAVKNSEDKDERGFGQLAALLTAENQEKALKTRKAMPKTDAIQAILSSAGVEYTHDNAEVVGSSRVEEQLSRQAVMTSYAVGDAEGQSALFADADEGMGEFVYRPPEDVCVRQFCEMAKEMGFEGPTEFALVVEGWSLGARTRCLDEFYKGRGGGEVEGTEEHVWSEVKRVKGEIEEDDFKREDVGDEEEIKIEGELMEGDVKYQVKEEDFQKQAKDKVKKEEAVEGEIRKDSKKIKMEDVNKDATHQLHHINAEQTPIKSEASTSINARLTPQQTSIFILDDDDDDDDEL
ncbi:SNF2-related protein [Ophiocordyceps camponoti-floridani]|uniref:SNF2-related protein n=1 Tax=Ophiocordyceps camponoti-floridani TaxID=2030778 RepID=A0A8H4Q5K8_9HYPO|nr:SNF2-related protein [Ophiocordyceps camponoti-floridani]